MNGRSQQLGVFALETGIEQALYKFGILESPSFEDFFESVDLDEVCFPESHVAAASILQSVVPFDEGV